MIPTIFRPKHGAARGFSLIEVIAALGMFAAGILVVLAFFPVLSRSSAELRNAEAAQNAAAVYVQELSRLGFEQVQSRLKTSAAIATENNNVDYDPAADLSLRFASLSAEKRAAWADLIWNEGRETRFFELSLVRNEDLSPIARDPITSWLAFFVRVRWPASVVTLEGGAAVANSRVPRDQQHEFILTASVRR